jgi:hypothetical protein
LTPGEAAAWGKTESLVGDWQNLNSKTSTRYSIRFLAFCFDKTWEGFSCSDQALRRVRCHIGLNMLSLDKILQQWQKALLANVSKGRQLWRMILEIQT